MHALNQALTITHRGFERFELMDENGEIATKAGICQFWHIQIEKPRKARVLYTHVLLAYMGRALYSILSTAPGQGQEVLQDQ